MEGNRAANYENITFQIEDNRTITAVAGSRAVGNRAANYESLTFQIGDNMTITVVAAENNGLWGWTYHRYDYINGIGSLSGSGNMYSDASEFVCLTDPLVTWDQVMFNQVAPYDYYAVFWNVRIPNGCTSIASRFLDYECGVALRSLIIPNGVVSIGDQAFRQGGLGNIGGIGWSLLSVANDLSEIDIPSSVTHIGAGAFESRRNLKTIRFENINYVMEVYTDHGGGTSTATNNIFNVSHNTGTDLDNNGYQYTHVYGGPGVKLVDWINLFGRHAIFEIEGYWSCFGNGKILKVPMYPIGEGELEISVADYLDMRLSSKLINKESSPIRICTNTQTKEIKGIDYFI